MGNIASTFGRSEDFVRQDDEYEEALDSGIFLEEPRSVDFNDYQQTLHQYLSQRYANRYNAANITNNNTNAHQRTNQPADTATTRPAPPTALKSKNTSFNRSNDILVLSLKGQKLTAVPRELFHHSDVTSLDLSDNELNELPKEIGSLSRITRIAMGGNQIIQIPDELCDLKELAWFDFTHNRISFLPKKFGNLKNLTSLGASDCRFSEFPLEICKLPNIGKLGIFNNMFTKLPPEIGNMKHLTKLDLSGNVLSVLPVEIGKLTNLTWLNLSYNRLECLPEEIKFLTKLTELGLAHNKLKKLPDLTPLQDLNLLPVYNNELEELGEWIGNLTSLQKLDLSCNNLETLPTSILVPTKMAFINLRKNKLREFPHQIFDKRIGVMMQTPIPMELAQVDLRENRFEYLPLGLIGPALVELKTDVNPWKLRSDLLTADNSDIKTVKIEIPSLLDLVCSNVLQDESTRALFTMVPRPLQVHIIQKSHTCQQCERPFSHHGIDCVLWRATNDSPEVPFKANVCSRTCLKSLDAYPINI